MARGKRKARPATDVPSSMPAYPTGEGDSKPLTIRELEQLMLALGAAGAVLLGSGEPDRGTGRVCWSRRGRQAAVATRGIVAPRVPS
jgi:hypothetical protein